MPKTCLPAYAIVNISLYTDMYFSNGHYVDAAMSALDDT